MIISPFSIFGKGKDDFDFKKMCELAFQINQSLIDTLDPEGKALCAITIEQEIDPRMLMKLMELIRLPGWEVECVKNTHKLTILKICCNSSLLDDSQKVTLSDSKALAES